MRDFPPHLVPEGTHRARIDGIDTVLKGELDDFGRIVRLEVGSVVVGSALCVFQHDASPRLHVSGFRHMGRIADSEAAARTNTPPPRTISDSGSGPWLAEEAELVLAFSPIALQLACRFPAIE